jgi:hypothetical protein
MNEELKTVLDRLSHKDWKTRASALDALLALAERDPASVRRDAAAVVDDAARRLGDGNLKVATAAVSAVRKLVESPALHGGALDGAVAMLMPSLASATAKRQRAVAAGCTDIIDRVLARVDARYTVAPLVGAISGGNSTVRGVLLGRLAAIIPTAHKQRPGLVQRVVLPKMFPLLDDKKLETRNGAASVVTAAAKVIGVDGVRKVASSSSGTHSRSIDAVLDSL